MNQGSFSFMDEVVGAHVRHTDPDTSHAAADSFSEERLSECQADVLDYYRRVKEASDEQLYQALRWKYPVESTARKRRTDLVQMGYLMDTGKRTLNSNESWVVVWGLAEETNG